MNIFKFIFLGGITSFIFPPFMMFPLGIIIFPFLHMEILRLTNNESKKKFFLSGFLFGCGFFSVFLFWIINPFLIYDSTKPFAFLSFILVLFFSSIFGISFIIFKYIKNDFLKIISIPVIFITIEMLLSNLLYGFPWLIFSLSVSNNLLALNIVKYFGTHFTSFVIINFYLLPSIFIFWEKIELIYKITTLCIIFTIILLSIFINIYLSREENISSKILSVELFQLNNPVNSVENLYSNQIYKEIEKNVLESEAEIIIFAENNFPYLVEDINNLKISSILQDNQQLIIGVTRVENEKYYNSILNLNNNKSQYFDKKILVPFGEFLPMRKYLKFFEAISGNVDFSFGTEERILELDKNTNFIPIICYEIIFFWKLLNSKNINSNLLINITNDGWFGKRIGPYQHFYLSKMRAAEFNKYLIRVSNNGISGIINNDGKVLTSTKLDKKEKIKYDLILNKHQNFFIFHKYINFILISFFVFVICLIIYGKKKQ